MTPFTLFTSYRREDAGAVARLERELRLRGVRSWRDLKRIPHGAEALDEVRRAIRTETNGCLAYITPEYLARRVGRPDVVWEIELPEAAARWKAGGYGFTPLFCGTNPRDLTDRCVAERLPDLAAANGARVPRVADETDQGTRVAERDSHRTEARAQLANALREVGGSVALAFRSFPMATLPNDTGLDIDWTGEIDGASGERWTDELVPALCDLHDAFGDARITHVEVHILARLNAALALGMLLPLAAGIEFAVHGRDGEEWLSEVAGGANPLRERRRDLDGASNIAVLELSLIADLSRDADGLVEPVRAGTHMRLAIEETDRTDLRPVAAAIARQVGDAARRLRDQGVNELHVLLACPAPLAFLIGRQLHTLGQVHTYFSDNNRSVTHGYVKPRRRWTMFLRESFKAFLGNINPDPDDVRPAVEAHTTVREFLESDEGLAGIFADSFLAGSYARDTSIAPIKDLDVVVETTYERMTTTPRIALNALRKALRRKYTGDDATVANRRSVLVDLPGTQLTMDIIPAIASGGRDAAIWVPDRGLNEWIVSHPFRHITLAQERNKRSAEIGDRHLYLSVVKMLRWWRHRQLEGFRHPKGFLIEVLCLECTPLVATEWPEVLLRTLDGIASRYGGYKDASDPPQIADPAVPGSTIRTKMSARDFSRFLGKVNEAREILTSAIASEENAESAKLYRRLFGDAFPDSGDGGTKKSGGGVPPAATLYPRSERNVRNPPGFA